MCGGSPPPPPPNQPDLSLPLFSRALQKREMKKECESSLASSERENKRGRKAARWLTGWLDRSFARSFALAAAAAAFPHSLSSFLGETTTTHRHFLPPLSLVAPRDSYTSGNHTQVACPLLLPLSHSLTSLFFPRKKKLRENSLFFRPRQPLFSSAFRSFVLSFELDLNNGNDQFFFHFKRRFRVVTVKNHPFPFRSGTTIDATGKSIFQHRYGRQIFSPIQGAITAQFHRKIKSEMSPPGNLPSSDKERRKSRSQEERPNRLTSFEIAADPRSTIAILPSATPSRLARRRSEVEEEAFDRLRTFGVRVRTDRGRRRRHSRSLVRSLVLCTRAHARQARVDRRREEKGRMRVLEQEDGRRKEEESEWARLCFFFSSDPRLSFFLISPRPSPPFLSLLSRSLTTPCFNSLSSSFLSSLSRSPPSIRALVTRVHRLFARRWGAEILNCRGGN